MKTNLPADIAHQIKIDFGETKAAEVINYLLEKIPERMPNSAPARLFRCIVYLAEGDRDKLDQAIDLCVGDPRDVMFGAEYEVQGSRCVRKRDFNKPFGKAELTR